MRFLESTREDSARRSDSDEMELDLIESISDTTKAIFDVWGSGQVEVVMNTTGMG